MKDLRATTLYFISLQLFMLKCNSYDHTGYNTTLIRVYRQTRNGCIMPHHPKFGKWTVYKTSAPNVLQPEDLAPIDTILQVECQDSYRLDGDATMVCIRGKWTSFIGECLLTCSSRHSTSILTVTCSLDGRILESCEQPVDGTKAQFQCADYYEDKSLEINPIHVCYNGKWNYNLPECIPMCGQKKVKIDPTLIVGGNNTGKLEYPWQVALYNTSDKSLLCGGSLISQRVVLTAAHCVTDDKGEMLPKDIYILAVGKYYRKFEDEKDTYAQYSSIHKMFTPRQYKGEIQNYFGDVALIVSTKTFILSPRVQPVCIDWGLLKYKALLNPQQSTFGLVTGWGLTVEYKNPSEVLKELRVPLVSDSKCQDNMPEDYERFLTDDKICAGFTYAGTSVCKGDSGGGLVANYKGQYYLVAVVSLSPQAPTQEGGCDSQQYALYTRVPYYIDFILDKTVRYKPDQFDQCEQDCYTSTTKSPTTSTTTQQPTTATTEGSRIKCILPEHPKNGNWSIFGVLTKLSPGMKVLEGTILKISCEEKNILNGAKITVCSEGIWSNDIGTCLKACPPLHSTETILVTCSFNDTKLNCSKPFDGVIAKYTCPQFYEDSEFSKSPVRVCVDGDWDKKLPECVPICGVKSVSPQLLIVNGKVAEKGEYPWHIALYRGSRQKYYCGGSLISPQLILTAAHCVTDWKGKLLPIEEFVVAAGKSYVDYFNPSDVNAQFSKLQNVFIPPQYTGTSSNSFGNLAVLVTKKPFRLTKFIQPVCMDWANKFIDIDFQKNITGFVSGWGFTDKNEISPLLRTIEVPLISTETCIENIPAKAINFVTPDRLCAGYLNKNTSICKGDSGGGLVTKHNGRFYLTGIVSTGIAGPDGGCDSNQYSLYTKISYYSSFILDTEARSKSTTAEAGCENSENCQQSTTIKPEVSSEPPKLSCVLPPNPRFGRWAVLKERYAHTPGESVPEGAILQVACYKNYKLNGDSTILCINGKWSSNIGSCERLCLPVYSTFTTKAICIQNNKNFENCTEAVDGTSVKYECIPFYENVGLTNNPIRYCKDGSWDSVAPKCIPVCGQKSVTPQVLISNGGPANRLDYPWHVAIYRGSENKFICNGAIVNENIVVTSAVCVTNYKGEVESKDLYTVVAGKYYSRFNDTRDNLDNMQQRKLKEIFVHPRYQTRTYNKNVAILVTEKPFIFSYRIQPICIDWNLQMYKSYMTSRTLSGYITGWGSTSNGDAEELQELKVPIINNTQCALELPPNSVHLLTSDRFCAGYRNQSKSICRGDSGGALAVKFNEKYYLTGIADIVPTIPLNGCDDQHYGIYANISASFDFILPIVNKY